MTGELMLFAAIATAGLVAALATPVFAAVARRRGLVVAPREDRWHRVPTPLLGGAAIALGAFVVLVLALPPDTRTLTVLLAGGMALALGLLDDFRHLAPATKLAGQALVGAALVFGGVQVGLVTSAPLAFVLTVFWVVVLMNALNLMDNMDGLAAGVAAIGGIALAVSAWPENPQAALVAAATAGAALGFLVHNFHPAKVFMGDAGSLLLGALLASASLLHTAGGAANVGIAILGPLAILALPIFDTLLVSLSRGLAGIPISRGGRDHMSHRLAALGLSDRATVLLLYAIALGLAALGMVAEAVSDIVLPLLALAAVGLVLFGVFLAEEVDIYRHRATDSGGAHARVLQALHRYGRFGIEVGLDVALLTVAYYAAYLIRFEGVSETAWLYLFVNSLPIVVGAQLFALVALRVYRALWRYLGIADAIHIFRAITVGTAIALVGLLLFFRFEGYSRAVFVLDWLLAAGLLVGARAFVLWLRHWFAGRPRDDARRVLIVGATDRGVLALRLLNHSREHPYRAVGFLDDDPGKRYRRVAGVPVVGTTADLEAALERLDVDLVVLALDNVPRVGEELRARCVSLGIECREVLVPV